MYTNRLFHLLIVTVLLVITACAPQVEPAATVAPADTATLAPTSTPTVAPTATVQPTKTATKIPVYLPFQAGKYLIGNDPPAYITFNEDGRWVRYDGGGFRIGEGKYSIDGDTYIMETFYSSLAVNNVCPVPMTYKYTFDGRLLKFQLTDQSRNDPCSDRKDRYNNKTYILAP